MRQLPPLSHQMMRIRFRVILACITILVATQQLLGLSNASETDETATKGSVRQSFKFDPHERHLLIPVRIGSRDYKFVVDTGTTGNVFDSSLRTHLGAPVDDTMTMDSGNEKTDVKLYEAPSDVKIGSLPLSEGHVLCENLTSLREHTGSPLYGILGMDFLNEWIIAVDFDEGRLDFLWPATQPRREWGECVRFAFRAGGSPCFPAKLAKDTSPSFFLLDTGFPDTGALQETMFSKLVESHELRTSGQRRGGSVFNEFVSRLGRISRLNVGTFQHENLLLEKYKNKNILGLGYLRRYRMTIDFPGERLYLAKGKRFSEPDRGSMCGTYFLFKPNKIVVESVDEKSPAYAAGVRANDILVQICGRKASELKPSAIRRLLNTEGKIVTMTLRRGSKEIGVTFTLKEYD